MFRSLVPFFRLLFLATGYSSLALSTAWSAPVGHPFQHALSKAARSAAGSAATTTTITSGSNPSTAGQLITFTVNIASSGGPPATVLTGIVTYSVDGAAVGSGYVSNGYYSTYNTAYLAVGSHTVLAAYSGDSNFAPSTSNTLIQVINTRPPFYVSPSGADSNPGTQAAPKLTIQAAINATVSGGMVIVEDGTYTGPGNVDLDFGGRSLTVKSQNGSASTIIDCGGSSTSSHRGFYLHSGEMNAVISGLTIKNGYEPSDYGGGIYYTSSSLSSTVTVSGCTLTNNTAEIGGGFYNTGVGTISINGCIISSNMAVRGGGAYDSNDGTTALTNCIILSNTATEDGGGLENSNSNGGTITVTGCTLSGNMAAGGYNGQGGGIYNYNTNGGGGVITVTNCTLTGNVASSEINREGFGGGIYNYSYDSTGKIIISNCILSGNTAYVGDLGSGIWNGGLGGGIFNNNSYGGTFTEVNCVFYGNIANTGSSNSGTSGRGGGLCSYASGANADTVTNCTFTQNAAPVGSGGAFYSYGAPYGAPVLTNDILYSDSGGEISSSGNGTPSIVATTCDIQNGYAGTSNISADPQFVLPPFMGAFPDLHLQYGSPCLGAGTVSGAPTTTIDGMMRPNPPSIGAYEVYVASTAVTVTNASGTAGQTVILSAALSNSGMVSVSGKTLSFSVDGVVVGAAVTNNSGTATLLYAIPAGTTVGSHALSASFAGDPTNSASSSASTLTVSAAGPLPVIQARFAPRVGLESRMVGGQFQGSSDGVTYTTLATIAQAPPDNQLTTLTFASPAAYRFLRYLAPNGAYGNIAELEFDSQGKKLAGTAFGTAGSYANSGSDFTKAFDGSTSTYFDAPSPGNGDFVGIDQATGTTGLGEVHFAPRATWASRMIGGRFQGSSDGVTYTDLAVVASAPPDGQQTVATLTVNPKNYRFLRYLAPDGAYGNIAELGFYSGVGASAVKLTGTAFGTPGSWQNNGNDFTKAFDENVSTYFDAPEPGNGDFVGIDRGAGYTKLTGTPFGTPGSWSNNGNDFTKAFDGNTATFFDAPEPGNGDFVGMDLGPGNTAPVTRIGYCPRAGLETRMVGGVFQGSSDNMTWTDLYTVTSAPAAGTPTETTLTGSVPYRYLRYLAPNGSYGNIAELEFDTSP